MCAAAVCLSVRVGARVQPCVLPSACMHGTHIESEQRSSLGKYACWELCWQLCAGPKSVYT